VAEVTIDKLLAEARQYALALATVTKTLASMGEEAAPGATAEDELERRRKDREKARTAKNG
jgi:ribosomal protein L12E/L44/L45/RPP1/RPP2